MADTHQTRSETTASQPKEKEEKKTLPDSENALVIRTDFSNQATWDTIVKAIRAPSSEGYLAYVDTLDEPAFRDLTTPELLTLSSPSYEHSHSFLMVVDGVAVLHPEHAVLVVDLSREEDGEFGRTFRAVPREVQAIQNNLSIANMDFEDFAESVDADGVFRGFPA